MAHMIHTSALNPKSLYRMKQPMGGSHIRDPFLRNSPHEVQDERLSELPHYQKVAL